MAYIIILLLLCYGYTSARTREFLLLIKINGIECLAKIFIPLGIFPHFVALQPVI
jgi:hypothetical protein